MTQETQITSKRLTLVDKDDYVVDLEYNEDFLILHLPFVKKMKKSVLQDMLVTFDDILELVHTFGHDFLWAAINPEDKLTGKLILKFGFEYQGSADGLDVYKKET